MKKEVVTYINPNSPVSETIKHLRTNIQFMNVDKELKTLLVTSTLPGEGKSWVSSNLAVAFAQADKKTLLVDADMRAGRQFNIFDVAPIPGLSNYLSGVMEGRVIKKKNIEEFIQKTEQENLFLLTSGSVPPNPSELLISEKMIDLISWIKDIFDVIIFDGPPSLLVTDAPALARAVDSTVIVTAYNQTKLEHVEKVKKSIENVGGKIAGVILNKVPESNNGYGDSYYYNNSSNIITKKKENYSKNIANYAKFEEFDYEEETPKALNSNKSQKNQKDFEENIYKTTQDFEEVTIDRTQDILKQINTYLKNEKDNLK